MKRFVWLRMVFRAMGLLFVGLSLPQCFQFLSQIVSYAMSPQMRAGWSADFGQILYTLGWGFGGYLQLGLGIYLLFYGQRLRDWCLRDDDGRCPRCDYEIGEATVQCPECGLRVREAAAEGSAHGGAGS